MSWNFSMTRPGHALGILRADLFAEWSDEGGRLVGAIDALTERGFEPQSVCDAVRVLRGDALDVQWFSRRDGERFQDWLDLEANYTYNVSPMFYEAFDLLGKDGKRDGIRGLDGRTGHDAGKALDTAILAMESAPDRFKAMNPKNGWGDYNSALALLRKLRNWCAEYPDAVMQVH